MTIYRLSEIALYALLSFLPFVFLAYYPFQNQLRFSIGVTLSSLTILCLIRIGLTYWTSIADRRWAIVLLGTVIYALFYILLIDAPLGKCLFFLLIFSNISNFILTATKCTEKRIFPDLYFVPYRWSSSIILVCMEILILIPLFFYLKKIFAPTVLANDKAWRYLWLIPLTFYSVWFRNFYFSAEGSVVLSGRLPYLFFSLLINLGALLVYTTVGQLISQYAENALLQEKAHQLSLQHTLYNNLQDRIEEARHMRHDLKQHLHVVSAYLQDKKYEELETYLGRYQKSMINDTPLVYCDNHAINALLQYFAGYAKIVNTGFSASISLPNEIGIPDEVLTVVLGNLLENAIEACIAEENPHAVISVHGKLDKGSVFFKIINTSLTPPKTDTKGRYFSSKRKGYGIGLQSVRNITERYDGVMGVFWEDGKFIVSVLLNIP